MFTLDELHETWFYNMHTGEFYRYEDGYAGYIDKAGYRAIRWNGEHHRAHRWIYKWVTGDFPTLEIDHKNRNKLDNRWENLRLVNRHGQNQNIGVQKNNQLGEKNISRRRNGYYVQVMRFGRTYSHQCVTLLEAVKYRDMLLATLDGEIR